MKTFLLIIISLLIPLAAHSNSFNPYLDSYYAGVCNALDQLKNDNKEQTIKKAFMYFDIDLTKCDEYTKIFKKYSSIQTTQLQHADFKIDSLILLNHINTVIADKGKPNSIEPGKGGMNGYYNLYKYDGFTIYVDKKDSLIYAFEIDSPEFTTYRGLNVGDSFEDIVAVHLYPFKSDSFLTCGPLDFNYRNGIDNVSYEIIYSNSKDKDSIDKWQTQYMTLFLKDDIIIRIFIHQGSEC